MDTSNPVFSGLIRKRQEISAELDAAQSRVRQLVIDIDALDATLRLFQPDVDLDVVRVRPIPRRHEALRGDAIRLVQTILREAGEPLTVREITVRMMTARGMNLSDHALVVVMRKRVGSSLRQMRGRGRVVSGEGKGSGMRWGLAG
jgi:hypothetical protein